MADGVWEEVRSPESEGHRQRYGEPIYTFKTMFCTLTVAKRAIDGRWQGMSSMGWGIRGDTSTQCKERLLGQSRAIAAKIADDLTPPGEPRLLEVIGRLRGLAYKALGLLKTDPEGQRMWKELDSPTYGAGLPFEAPEQEKVS